MFLGWGPADPEDRSAREAEEEDPEAPAAGERTPAIMVVPAIVLVLAGAVVGLVPGLVHGVERAAELFRDGHGYALTVLRGAPSSLPAAAPHHVKALDVGLGVLSTLGALATASVGLAKAGPAAAMRRALENASAPLRALHSGVVGDYVAWITLGLAGLGGSFLLALR